MAANMWQMYKSYLCQQHNKMNNMCVYKQPKHDISNVYMEKEMRRGRQRINGFDALRW